MRIFFLEPRHCHMNGSSRGKQSKCNQKCTPAPLTISAHQTTDIYPSISQSCAATASCHNGQITHCQRTGWRSGPVPQANQLPISWQNPTALHGRLLGRMTATSPRTIQSGVNISGACQGAASNGSLPEHGLTDGSTVHMAGRPNVALLSVTVDQSPQHVMGTISR